jgi:hypothetical protein
MSKIKDFLKNFFDKTRPECKKLEDSNASDLKLHMAQVKQLRKFADDTITKAKTIKIEALSLNNMKLYQKNAYYRKDLGVVNLTFHELNGLIKLLS